MHMVVTVNVGRSGRACKRGPTAILADCLPCGSETYMRRGIFRAGTGDAPKVSQSRHSLTHSRAAQAAACRRLSPLLSGCLLFLFALVSFSLGHAQVLTLGRAGAMGAEKPGQTLYAGNRDSNRATPIIERKDPPQTVWTGDGWGLTAIRALPSPYFTAARLLPVEPQALPLPARHDRLPRGPPA